MFRVDLEVRISLPGEKHLKQRKKPYKSTEKNFIGNIIILLFQNECEETAYKYIGVEL